MNVKMKKMLEQVRQTIAQYKMIEPGDRIVVGVSGGIDSMTLLHVLCCLKGEYRLTLSVAHLDHQLRPDSERDARFVADHAQHLELPCVVGRASVSELASRERLSLEDAARRARYDFLQRTAEQMRANRLALGHTLNDQVETFFMRLLRGSGLQGLGGIPPTRVLTPTLTLIRPFIKTTRAQIEAYAQQHRLNYREDPTNQETHFTRNQIRHELLVWLEREFNPNLLKTVGRTQELLQRAARFLEKLTEGELAKLTLKREKSSLRLDRIAFEALDPFVQSLTLREAIRRVHKRAAEVGYDHIEEMLTKIRSAPRSRVELPGRLLLKMNAQTLELARARVRHSRPFDFEIELCGTTVVTEIGWRFTGELLDLDRETFVHQMKAPRGGSPLEVYFDFDTIKGRLHVRRRRPGDRFAPFGLKGTKKLQDFFVDEKVPAEERDQIPLLCDEQEILWVVGRRTSHDYRVRARTRRILKISAARLEEDSCRTPSRSP
jgi:tRNA(Ile)-lysidine synthase